MARYQVQSKARGRAWRDEITDVHAGRDLRLAIMRAEVVAAESTVVGETVSVRVIQLSRWRRRFLGVAWFKYA